MAARVDGSQAHAGVEVDRRCPLRSEADRKSRDHFGDQWRSYCRVDVVLGSERGPRPRRRRSRPPGVHTALAGASTTAAIDRLLVHLAEPRHRDRMTGPLSGGTLVE